MATRIAPTNTSLTALIQALTGAMGDRAGLQRERKQEVGENRSIREDYSKENAFADAQGLMAQQLAEAMQESLSALTRSAEGAGASGSSLRALLVQQAAQSAAQRAAALGAQQAVQYGNITNDTSQILELLTRPDDAALQALLEAQRIRESGKNSKPTSSSPTRQTTTGNNPMGYQQQPLAQIGIGAPRSFTAAPMPYQSSIQSGPLKKPANEVVSFGPTRTGFDDHTALRSNLPSMQNNMIDLRNFF